MVRYLLNIIKLITGKETPLPKQKTIKNITKEGRKELAQAERMARKLVGTPKRKNASKNNKGPRIVSDFVYF